jgi:hypothetical protein
LLSIIAMTPFDKTAIVSLLLLNDQEKKLTLLYSMHHGTLSTKTLFQSSHEREKPTLFILVSDTSLSAATFSCEQG